MFTSLVSLATCILPRFSNVSVHVFLCNRVGNAVLCGNRLCLCPSANYYVETGHEKKKSCVYVWLFGHERGKDIARLGSNVAWYENKEEKTTKKKAKTGKDPEKTSKQELIDPRPQNSPPTLPARRPPHPSSRLKETQHPLKTTTATRTASHSPKHLQARGYASCA